jgi:ribosomal protein S27AE
MSARLRFSAKTCPEQIACDGDVIANKKYDKTMCGKCERALAKRAKGLMKPKGTKLYPEDADV